MSIKSTEDLEKLRIVGRIVRLALDEMARSARVGITTAELDAIGLRVLNLHGAEAAPPKVYGFPGSVCISVNDEAVHGVPGARTLRNGDLLKLDLVATKDGYFADAAVTVRIGTVSDAADALVRCAESAFWKAMTVARTGYRTRHIGREIESEVRRQGFSIMPDLGGHGVGRTIHEPPEVPNFHDVRCNARLFDGLVIAVEPIVAAGRGEAVVSSDRWTVKTADRSLSAHYEHTIVITKTKPIILTA
jgi:methionyl aminopeptidase